MYNVIIRKQQFALKLILEKKNQHSASQVFRSPVSQERAIIRKYHLSFNLGIMKRHLLEILIDHKSGKYVW